MFSMSLTCRNVEMNALTSTRTKEFGHIESIRVVDAIVQLVLCSFLSVLLIVRVDACILGRWPLLMK